jgi:hypothetical protein
VKVFMLPCPPLAAGSLTDLTSVPTSTALSTTRRRTCVGTLVALRADDPMVGLYSAADIRREDQRALETSR